MAKSNLTKQQAIERLWHMGNLSYKLKGVQKEMREAIYNSKGKKTVFLIARRTGKTFVMMTVAVEYCIKNPNVIVKVLFPKKKDAKKVAQEQMVPILQDCPKDLMPERKVADDIYLFPNGSQIQMAGTDAGNAESVRGSSCDLALLDEAGFHDYHEFSYIIQSIIMPTLLTTKGKMVLASTPSKQEDHPFMTDYVLPARLDNTIIEFDVYSNPLINDEDIKEIAAEYPQGVEDPAFQREFLLISAISSEDFVVPEFTKEVQKDIIDTWKKPVYYDAYVSGDPAVTDLTVMLFAYYDYLNGKIIIEDELVLGGPGEPLTTKDIADGIKRKESLLFKNDLTAEIYEPYMRIMDNNNKFLINDLYQEHGLRFIATAKDEKIAQINKLRIMLSQGQIIINPKCKNLIYHLQTARWKKTRNNTIKGFQRVKGDKSRELKPHHADAVDALIYLVRNVDINKNPYPREFFASGGNVFNSEKSVFKKTKKATDFMKKIANIRKND